MSQQHNDMRERDTMKQHKLEKVFHTKRPIIAAIHFLPMPGFAGFTSLDNILKAALTDVKAAEAGGVDGLILENNYDLPHRITVGPETVACMTYLVSKIKDVTNLPLGISVLWNDYRAALAIANATGGAFIRVPVFVDHVRTSYGDVKGDATAVLSMREQLQAEDVLLFTDIHVKHAELLNKDTLATSAKKAVQAGTDALILTGKWTGDAPDLSELEQCRKTVGSLPILVGSGADKDNIQSLLSFVDGVIVSTSLKTGKNDLQEVNRKQYTERINKTKVKTFVQAFQKGIIL
jgi:membrane complex biogenesis BtpA family protein